MPNPTQSPAETNGLQIKPGTRILHQHGGYGVITRRNPQPFGDGKGAWMVRYDDRPDAETPALEMFMTVEPVSPAAVSDLCDACGAVACKSKDGHETCGSSVGPLRFCASCWVSRTSYDEALTRRRSPAEPGFKVGDIVNGAGAGSACQAEGRRYEGRVMRFLNAYGNEQCALIQDPKFGERVCKLKDCRLIRRAPTEAARTGEAWEPKVGDRVTGIGSSGGRKPGVRITGKITCLEPISDRAHVQEGDGWATLCDRASLRPLPPATAGWEPTREADPLENFVLRPCVICQKQNDDTRHDTCSADCMAERLGRLERTRRVEACLHNNADHLEYRCLDCGATGKTLRVSPAWKQRRARRKAYDAQTDKETHGGNWGKSPANVATYQAKAAEHLDRAIATARSAIESERDQPTGPILTRHDDSRGKRTVSHRTHAPPAWPEDAYLDAESCEP